MNERMAILRRRSIVFTIGFFLALASHSVAQQPSSPVRRLPNSAPASSAQPQNAARPDAQTKPQLAGLAPAAAMPRGFSLNPQQQARVDQILNYWEHHTSKIKTYECKFVRHNFDFVFGSRTKPATIDYGTIRYKSPDKGLMRVDKTYKRNAQETDPEKEFVQQDVQFGEYWVCDGESVYKFDAHTKVLTESRLPPEMRGQAIAEGPLPFVFGAKADQMKQRYWIREVTPQNNPKGEYYLEAVPRLQADAANFDRLVLQLTVTDGQLFPHAMRLFNKNGYVQYEFQDHSPNHALHRVQGFLDSFVRPQKPSGWTKVVEDWNGVRLDDRQAVAPQGESPATGRR
jgi:TIGR03009 family protein